MPAVDWARRARRLAVVVGACTLSVGLFVLGRGSNVLQTHSAQAAVALVLIAGFVLVVVMARRATATEQLMADSERQFRMLAENASDVVLFISPTWVVLWASPATRQVLGYDPAELIGTDTAALVHPADLPVLVSLRADPVGVKGEQYELRVRNAAGEYRWMSGVSREAPDGEGKPVGRVSTLRDIHDKHLAQTALVESEQRYRLLAENATDVEWQLDADGVLVWVSPPVDPVLGWAPQRLLGKNVRDLIHPADLGATEMWKARILAGQHLPNLESRLLAADGSYKWMSLQVRPITSVDGSVTGLVVGMRTVDDEVRARSALKAAREHDPLTGLATMEVVLDRLDRLLADLDRNRPELLVGVLCVGVDSLKTVNEALDHAAGDLVLREVATRIATVVDDRELLARRPGDEFVVLVADLAGDDDGIVAAEKIRMAVKGPMQVGSEVFGLAVSIGITTGSVGRRSREMVREAALAMHEAKILGRDRCVLFQVLFGQVAQHRLTMEQEIRDGLRDGQMVPWFQPIVALDGGAVVGYEALVRWIRADGSIVSPGEFLPVAEQSPLIVQLDLIILRRSVDVLSRLPPPMHVSVNVSAATLNQEEYARWVVRALQVYGVDPARLHLEFTETAVLSITDRVRHGMGELADRGIGWYVDDFGTGYSSMAHLRDLPIAGMKLDLSFTAAIEAGDQNAETLAAGMAALAADLGLATVAEGIETDNQAAILRAQGWEYGQGLLYGRPEPAAAILGAAAGVPSPWPRPPSSGQAAARHPSNERD